MGRRHVLLMQSEESPFRKQKSYSPEFLTLTFDYTDEKVYNYFLHVSPIAIKGYGGQLFTCLLRVKEK